MQKADPLTDDDGGDQGAITHHWKVAQRSLARCSLEEKGNAYMHRAAYVYAKVALRA